jgi:hypothetical protein
MLLAAGIGLGGPTACAPTVRLPAPSAIKRAPPRSVFAPRHPSDPEDVPVFVQHAGVAKRTQLRPATAAVVGRLVTPSATYLLIRATHEGTLADAQLETVTSSSGRSLACAVAGLGTNAQSLSSPEYDLVLRIAAGTPIDDLSNIQWTTKGAWKSDRWRGGYQQSVEVPDWSKAPIVPTLESEFGQAMARWFEFSGHGESFAAFAAARLMRRFVKNPSTFALHSNQPSVRQMALVHLMDFYTARSAVSDSLQIERGLQLPKQATPRIKTISSMKLDSRSIGESAPSALARSQQPTSVLSPLSDLLPADALVIEFATLRDLVQLPRLLDHKLGAVLRVAEAAGGSQHLMERYRKQLAIELDGFAETVGQFAIKSAAVALSDPYLREGTDVTLVFSAENQQLLDGVLQSHLQRAKGQYPDLRSTQEQIAGETVRLHATTDFAVRRFEYAFGNYRILSNARAAMARMIRVKQGKSPKLSEDQDYLAARAEKPFHPASERAFVYFGNGFVSNVVGPRSKILEARRMRAQAELQAVDHAALLFGWMEGHRPTKLTELLASGWLEHADLTHSDGTAITWSPTLGAHSAWGYAQSLTPLIDLPLDKISKEEASAYQSFRARYDTEMNGLVDPTALRFERTTDEDDIQTELSVFPVPLGGKFNTEYRHVTELVGSGRIEPGPVTRGLSVSLGVGDGSPLRNWADTGLFDLLGKSNLTVSFVGDWVKAGLDEGSAIWDLAANDEMIAQVADTGVNQGKHLHPDKLISKLPIWVAVHVRSRLLLSAALAALRNKIESGGRVHWYDDETFRNIPITRIQLRSDATADAAVANVYYAVAKDVLLISLRRNILEARIDEVLAGQSPRGSNLPTDSAQLALDLSPLIGGWIRQVEQAAFDRMAMEAHERACAGVQLLARGYGTLPNEPNQRRDIALRLLGHVPEPPQGGELSWQNGQCTGSIYGSFVEPVAPDARDPNVALHQMLSNFGTLRFTLGLVPRQNALELRARFQLRKETSTRLNR